MTTFSSASKGCGQNLLLCNPQLNRGAVLIVVTRSLLPMTSGMLRHATMLGCEGGAERSALPWSAGCRHTCNSQDRALHN